MKWRNSSPKDVSSAALLEAIATLSAKVEKLEKETAKIAVLEKESHDLQVKVNELQSTIEEVGMPLVSSTNNDGEDGADKTGDLEVGDESIIVTSLHHSNSRSNPFSHSSIAITRVDDSSNNTDENSISEGKNDHFAHDATRDGIHSWVLWMMTQQHLNDANQDKMKYFFVMYLIPLVSWVFLIIQCIVLCILGHQMMFPYCKAGRGSEDCEMLEQVCSVFVMDHFTYGREIGTCINDPEQEEGDCPYMKNMAMPYSSWLVLAVVFMIVCVGVLHDISANIKTTQAAKYRARQHGSNKWVHFYIWSIYLQRAYLIPLLSFFATALVLFVDADFRPSTILLNGVAVIIMNEFDDYLYDLFISTSTQALVGFEMREGYNRCDKGHSNRAWWFSRFYCLGLIIVCMAFLLFPISILTSNYLVPFFESFQKGYAVCADLTVTLSTTITYGVLQPFLFIEECMIGSKWYIKVRNWFAGFVVISLVWSIANLLAVILHNSLL